MSRLLPASLFCLALAAFTPGIVRAQIASPSFAAQNSGNNTSASSSTFFSTANFSSQQVPLVAGLTVEADGTLEGSPELMEQLKERMQNVVEGLDLARSLRLEASGPLLAAAGDVPITTAAAGSGAVQLRDNILQVSIAGALVDLPTTSANQAALRRFSEKAIKAGFTPASLSLGAQLVAIGTPVDATIQLMGSLQGLAAQPTLDALAQGIAAFNSIVNGASPDLRAQLNTNPVFIAAGTTLRTVREALPSQP